MKVGKHTPKLITVSPERAKENASFCRKIRPLHVFVSKVSTALLVVLTLKHFAFGNLIVLA